MKTLNFFRNAAAGLLFCWCAGCHWQEDFSRVAEEVPPPVSEAEITKRVQAFRKNWEKLPVRAISVAYPDLSPYDKMKPERFVSRLQQLGCNRLVITIRPDTDLHWDPLRAIAIAAAKAKIGLYFELEQKDYSLTFRGNRLIRWAYFWRVTLTGKCAEIEKFNRSLPEDARLGGIILTAQPDYFTEANRKDRPKTLLFSWSKDHYGIGLSNDAIVRYTMQSFRECVTAGSGEVPYLFSIPDHLHDAAKQKQLSHGTVADFSRLGDPPGREVFLNLEVRTKKARLDFDGANRELTDEGGKVVVTIDVASHPAIVAGDLPRQSWNGMVKASSFALRKWRKTPNFNGIMLGPWPVLQIMLGEW